jgi:hypothetical protein
VRLHVGLVEFTLVEPDGGFSGTEDASARTRGRADGAVDVGEDVVVARVLKREREKTRVFEIVERDSAKYFKAQMELYVPMNQSERL